MRMFSVKESLWIFVLASVFAGFMTWAEFRAKAKFRAKATQGGLSITWPSAPPPAPPNSWSGTNTWNFTTNRNPYAKYLALYWEWERTNRP